MSPVIVEDTDGSLETFEYEDDLFGPLNRHNFATVRDGIISGKQPYNRRVKRKRVVGKKQPLQPFLGGGFKKKQPQGRSQDKSFDDGFKPLLVNRQFEKLMLGAAKKPMTKKSKRPGQKQKQQSLKPNFRPSVPFPAYLGEQNIPTTGMFDHHTTTTERNLGQEKNDDYANLRLRNAPESYPGSILSR